MRTLLALAFALAAGGAQAADCAPATLHLLRHAEKAAVADDPDPPLSPAGQARAAALVTWAEGRPIDAIYATQLRRTQQTAAPLAAARDLELRVLPAADDARLLARLRGAHCGQHVLVVGHSNTVPALAQAFGAQAFAIAEHEFGTVFTLRPPAGAVERTLFGAAPAGTP